MNSEHLIADEELLAEKSLLSAGLKSASAAIDMGSTLTKILYVTDADKDQQIYELHCALFPSKHFESALKFLKEKLRQACRGDRKLRVTGVGVTLHEDRIREILNVETEFIDEAVCQFSGFYFLLKHCQLADICHPLPDVTDSVYAEIQRGEIFNGIREAQMALIKEQESGDKFPCLFAMCGSSAGVVLVKEDGSIVVKHRHLLAGKSFLGLCQLLIGTSDFAEIMRLAAAGKRGNIDTQIRDIQGDSLTSPYGQMPATLPFFPFGKAVDFDKSLEYTRREDVAHSLVSSFTVNFVNAVAFVANYEHIGNIFFGGNFFRSEFIRLEVAKRYRVTGASDLLRVNFLKTGHTAALGAMLSSKQDAADFFAGMKINGL